MSRADFEMEAEERKSKTSIHAPCVYIAWNESKRRDVECYPAVTCSCECHRCGWNPEVADARIAQLKERLQIGGAE